MRPCILIVGSNADLPSIKMVAMLLMEQGRSVCFYNTDKVLTGQASFRLTIDDKQGAVITYDGRQLHAQTVAAAWHRNPQLRMGLPPGDILKRQALEREYEACQDLLWKIIPKNRWFNPPDSVKLAVHKMRQLVLARSTGFDIPHTLITNKMEEVSATLPTKEVIMKLAFGGLSAGDTSRGLPTTVLSKDSKTLERLGSPFPGIWQEYIPKKREWRVTVVGDEVFAAAIYISEAARDDWRRHQFSAADVQFRKEKLPAHIADRCVRMVRRMGIGFGAFDFIETPDGRWIFLEVNANGQYQWLVDELGLPIHEAIARQLAAIADRNTKNALAKE